MSVRKRHINSIDGLRTIAFLLILLYHLRVAHFDGGFLGVVVFLVISGYFITKSIIGEIEKSGRINFKKYFIKRLRRIYPCLICVSFFVIIAFAFANRIAFTKAVKDLAAVLLGYDNIWQITQNASYFDNLGVSSPFTHIWTLAIEIQFYIFFPIIILLLYKLGLSKRMISRIVLGFALASAILMVILYSPDKDPSRVYYGTDTRLFSLFIGSYAALIVDELRIDEKTFRVLNIATYPLIILLVLLCIWTDASTAFLYRGGFFIYSLMCAVLIAVFSNSSNLLTKVLGSKPFRVIGQRSYGLYLWHYPIIILLSKGMDASFGLKILEVVLTFVISFAVYEFVEKRIAKSGFIRFFLNAYRNTDSDNRVTVKYSVNKIKAYTFLGLIVLTIGLAVFVPKEKVDIQNSNTVKTVNTAKVKTAEEIRREKEKEAEEYKKYEAIVLDKNILWIGDSVAEGAEPSFLSKYANGVEDAKANRMPEECYDILLEKLSEGWSGDAVVFTMGNNGVLNNVLEQSRAAIPEDTLMLVYELHAPYVRFAEDNNEKIRTFCNENKNTYYVPWDDFAAQHPEMIYDDETHVNMSGIDSYVDQLTKKLVEIYQDMDKETSGEE